MLDAVARPLGPIETSDNDQGWIIDPAAMPAGSALFFQGAQLGTPGSDSLMYNALVLLTGDDPGPCVPQTGPVPGYPGVWPYVAPPTPTPGPVSSPTPVSSLTP